MQGSQPSDRYGDGGAATILVVEDEPPILDMIALSLSHAGHRVLRAASGAEARAHAGRDQIDLALLDVMLPDTDGFTLLGALRLQHPGLGAVFVTARDGLEDRLEGLEVGDDYITKPFSLEEVAARVGAVLRRTRGRKLAPVEDRLVLEDLVMDDRQHRVWRSGAEVSLSPTEYALLLYLMRNAGRVVAKADILEQVWRYDFRGNSSVVDSYISYLRRKIDVTEPTLIQTVRGVGYVLRVAAP
ncbi:response regulator transcription factor [Nocardioides sp. Iso805N]|uniref:response regulator transcription factor n=1 Tax=Nocardioides sp. Iso805N TaxID=1283287 RepID=UPI000378CCBF|nr:response regulator transcription factor [Nocardioides sp. Iso805N]